MVYGYIRVSTEKPTTEVQKYEIEKYCGRNGLEIGCWIDETISGAKELGFRFSPTSPGTAVTEGNIDLLNECAAKAVARRFILEKE